MTRHESIPQKLLADAMHLSSSDRAALAEALWDSLESTDDATVKQAWDDEIQRRLNQIDRGEVELIPAKEVLAQLREITLGRFK